MAKHRTLYMETTQISPAKTAQEITGKLVAAGATQIAGEYADGRIVALKFVIRSMPYELPVRVEPIHKELHGRRDTWRRKEYEKRDREQAERVAWRQLLRWVEAQLAMIETGMVRSEEVFLPYLIGPRGRTFYQEFEERGMRLLAAPDPGGFSTSDSS